MEELVLTQDIITLNNIFYNLNNIPIVIISWNSLTFIKNFIEQFIEFPNPIVILDNNSSFNPLIYYYKEIQEKLPNKIHIALLKKNYGHEVYLKFKNQLPKIYILSDPYLKIGPNFPKNFAEIFLNLSNKYKTYKIGATLDISDKDLFINCPNYTHSLNIYDFELQYWKEPILDDNYELYKALVDTTFCLINNNYDINNLQIRIAGDFTMKHLPWYENYIKNNFLPDELIIWKENNKSSSLLFSCLELFS